VKPIAVIPSRYASVRLPGKPLARIGGKPMIEHVHDRCRESGAFSRVVVATDDARVADAVRAFGGEVMMTSPQCQSGTDRVAEVARALSRAAVIVNVQGDEPFIAPEALAQLAVLFDDSAVEMATLVRPLEPHERDNPNVVKAVLASNGDALYFSRADIPFDRDAQLARSPAAVARYAHLGVYGYRRETLLTIASLPPSPLELSERLEQLRALEAGIRIRCGRTPHASLGVDTPEDLVRAEALWATRQR
jgi:3-deoxy-manno-octulosonate cytidylyltransferase (CMP-KDO synthetase)